MDEETFAHTIIQGIPFEATAIRFEEAVNPAITVKYQEGESPYLEELKAAYPLDFIQPDMNDMDIVLAVLNWTHNRWDHNGNQSPSANDAITILNEANAGESFPCFAYAIVLRDQLNALGFKARTTYLKTQDAATRQSSPGHVATEVFLNDLQKWVFVDAQFNIMPFLDGTPLNAVELQDAITHHYDAFELRSLSPERASKKNYVSFVYDYLYYFDTMLDNRYEKDEWHSVDGKHSMMLVPVGAEDLTYIQFWD
ncbi:MAG: transglutaminase domain-containing protein, partial [Bacteroidota bacterium]